MKSEIQRIPVGELPEANPPIVVVALAGGETMAERYGLHLQPTASVPAGEQLVAILCVGPLSTPDQIRLTEAVRNDAVFQFEVEVRRYTGMLFANIETMALVQVELGRLAPGDYEVWVTESTWQFEDIDRPDNILNPTTSTHHLHFEVS
jgi:hypothetical protein